MLTGGTSVERGGRTAGARVGGGGMRCSLRVWVLLGSLGLAFLTSLFFSISLRGGVGLPYLEPPGWEKSSRVKLVPNYSGVHQLGPLESTQQQKTCACPRCVGDPGVSDWFDENYNPDISPVWTRDNIQLPSDVYYWWVVSDPAEQLLCFTPFYPSSIVLLVSLERTRAALPIILKEGKHMMCLLKRTLSNV